MLRFTLGPTSWTNIDMNSTKTRTDAIVTDARQLTYMYMAELRRAPASMTINPS